MSDIIHQLRMWWRERKQCKAAERLLDTLDPKDVADWSLIYAIRVHSERKLASFEIRKWSAAPSLEIKVKR